MPKLKVKVTERQPTQTTDGKRDSGGALASDNCDNPPCQVDNLRNVRMDPVRDEAEQELSPLSK